MQQCTVEKSATEICWIILHYCKHGFHLYGHRQHATDADNKMLHVFIPDTSIDVHEGKFVNLKNWQLFYREQSQLIFTDEINNAELKLGTVQSQR